MKILFITFKEATAFNEDIAALITCRLTTNNSKLIQLFSHQIRSIFGEAWLCSSFGILFSCNYCWWWLWFPVSCAPSSHICIVRRTLGRVWRSICL